ncbi:MAG TPA: hypothetical protein DCE56_21255, partial [Cyanobacteria bacterium UBA8553]|nr:hypothetical protein [Cyanobacteria bacterium UBA8553]
NRLIKTRIYNIKSKIKATTMQRTNKCVIDFIESKNRMLVGVLLLGLTGCGYWKEIEMMPTKTLSWEKVTLTNTLNGHTNPVYFVAITPDGQTIVSSSNDGTIRLWNL